MKREDDQELWDLLGKSSAPAVSPFFARDVLREIRQERTWKYRVTQWFQARRLIPAAAVAAAIIAAAVSFQRPAASPKSPDNLPDALAQLDPVDYEVVADLDDLLAMDEENLWDSDTSTL